ncbi:MAG: putative selenate ABC transporter substrate-binding protein [Verrucomicrobiota bacterium]
MNVFSIYFSKPKCGILLATLLWMLVLCGCGRDPNGSGSSKYRPLVISAIPDERVSDQEVKFEALKSYLANQLDIPVEFSISSDYGATVQRFRNSEIHLAWFGGYTGVQAREAVTGARAIAQGMVDTDFKSYLIAHQSTGLIRSEAFPGDVLREMTFTFGSPSSTSGRLMPTYFFLKETGQKPEDFFVNPVQFQQTGGHDATVRAVASGAVQLGVVSFKKYDSMVREGEIDPADAPVIWVTPGYPDYNLTVHTDLEEQFGAGFIDRLQQVLVDCEDPDVLRAFSRKKLIPASNEDFEKIASVARDLGMLR